MTVVTGDESDGRELFLELNENFHTDATTYWSENCTASIITAFEKGCHSAAHKL